MSGEKTEEPTQKKLEDAAKEGQTPQRKNVLEAFLLTLGVMLLSGLWQPIGQKIMRVFDHALQGVNIGFDAKVAHLRDAIVEVLYLVLSISMGLGLAVLLLNLLLNKFNFAPGAMKVKFEKLNPISGLKGIFSLNTVYSFIRMVIYFSAVSLILGIQIWVNLTDVVNAASCGLGCLTEIFPQIILSTVIMILTVLVILAALDFKLQNMMFKKQNKMSKDDVKRENKGMQGDPLIKGKRREIAEETLELPGPRDVTHVVYASGALVAMYYDPGTVPFVVMKVKGDAVTPVRQKFREMKVRCVNIPAVALSFHKRYRVGEYMDEHAADGMAKILSATGEL